MALPGNCDYYLNPWIQVGQRRVKAGRGGQGGPADDEAADRRTGGRVPRWRSPSPSHGERGQG